MSVTISQTIKTKPPTLPYQKIKDQVLGKKYNLSLVFVGTKQMKALNHKYRRQNHPTDVLSFPLDQNFGEIFICPVIANQKAPQFNYSNRQFTAYLFIHGLLHLKGLKHSSKMDKAEAKVCRVFNIPKPSQQA